MLGWKNQNNSHTNQTFKMDNLRKIQPSDRFPCFACFDNPRDKIGCNECGGNGWVSGSHPMVQFAEDFIEKRLSGLASTEMGNSYGHHSDIGDIGVRMSGSYDPQKRQREVLPITSSKTVALGDDIRQSKRFQLQQPLQQQYFCNQCITQQPIKGIRFHCEECEDYDLCQSCHLRGTHNMHELTQHAPFKKPDNQTLMTQIKQTQLKKSIKHTK